MRSAILVALSLITVVSYAGPATTSATGDRTQLLLLEDGESKVYLRFKPRTSAADLDGIRFRITNFSAVQGGHYRMEAQRIQDIKTGQGKPRGGLGSGLYFDLFGKNPTVPDDGVVETSLHPSSQCAMLLGLPPEGEEWEVQASATFQLNLNDRRIVSSWRTPTYFSFIWMRPTEAQLADMRNELKQRLDKPSDKSHDYSRLYMLLKHEELYRDITVVQALQAITNRKDGAERQIIVRFVATRWPTADAVVDHYARGIATQDCEMIRDLAYHGNKIWSPRFVEPLVKEVERQGAMDERRFDYQSFRAPLEVLAAHDADWPSDPKLTTRLAAAVRRAYPILDERDPAKIPADEWRYWIEATQFIALTRDLASAAHLRKFLDSKTQVDDFKDRADVDASRLAPFRACDHAHNTILEILRRKEGRIGTWPMGKTKDQQTADRDQAIQKLKQELIQWG